MEAPKTIVAASGWCYRPGSWICARSIKAGLTAMGVGSALRGFSARVSRPWPHPERPGLTSFGAREKSMILSFL